MRLIIAGTRYGVPPHIFNRVMTNFMTSLDLHPEQIECVISGGQTGVDTQGEQWAEYAMGIKVVRFPAEWDKHGKSAGPKRNAKMAKYAVESPQNAAVIIHNGGIGSRSMYEEAWKAGIKYIHAVNVDGEQV